MLTSLIIKETLSSEDADYLPSNEIAAALDAAEVEQMSENRDSVMFRRLIENVCTLWQSQLPEL